MILIETIILANQGFEVIDSVADRGRASLIAVSFVAAAIALLRKAFKSNFDATAIVGAAIVGGFVIWLVSGGYGLVGDVVDNEAENISEDIAGLD